MEDVWSEEFAVYMLFSLRTTKGRALCFSARKSAVRAVL